MPEAEGLPRAGPPVVGGPSASFIVLLMDSVNRRRC